MRKTAAGVAAAASIALVASGMSPAAAASGTKPLSEVLTADGVMFDSNWDDFDVVTQAVLTVLTAKPDSAVGLLTQGDKALTSFVQTDRAFRKLVGDLVDDPVLQAGLRELFKLMNRKLEDVEDLRDDLATALSAASAR